MKSSDLSLILAVVLAVSLVGCGGGSVDEGPVGALEAVAESVGTRPENRKMALSVSQDALAAANAVYALGESAYREYFPSQQATRMMGSWTYRYYPETGSYLAVIDWRVYVLGGGFGPEVVDVGAVSDYVTVGPPSPYTFGNGTHLVGATALPPGRYRSNNAQTASCYWARLKDTLGESGSTLANDIGGGPRVVDILGTDAAFHSSNCATWSAVVAPVTPGPSAPFTDGIFIVGLDIQPGTWASDGSGASCYWARLRGFTGVSTDTIANDFGPSPAIVTILPTDAGFEVSRCGTWTRIGP